MNKEMCLSMLDVQDSSLISSNMEHGEKNNNEIEDGDSDENFSWRGLESV